MDGVLIVVGPALLAGLVAIAVTVAIERLGGVLGGFLGTLPTTIVPASWGILAGSASDAAFADAMAAVPLGMLANVGFLFLWRALPPRLPQATLGVRLAVMLTLSLGVWSVLAVGSWALLDVVRSADGPLPAVGWAALALNITLGIAACLQHVPAPRGSQPVAPLVLVARGAMAALAIGVASALALLGVDVVAGIASVFPAIFVTTMVALWWSQGEAVPAGAVGPMMLGSSAVGAYAMVASITLPAAGPVLGTLLAWIPAAALVTAPATIWLQRRIRAGAA